MMSRLRKLMILMSALLLFGGATSVALGPLVCSLGVCPDSCASKSKSASDCCGSHDGDTDCHCSITTPSDEAAPPQQIVVPGGAAVLSDAIAQEGGAHEYPKPPVANEEPPHPSVLRHPDLGRAPPSA